MEKLKIAAASVLDDMVDGKFDHKLPVNERQNGIENLKIAQAPNEVVNVLIEAAQWACPKERTPDAITLMEALLLEKLYNFTIDDY